MTRRAFRVLLFLGLIGTAALAGYQGWRLERARVRQLASADAFDTVTLRLAQAVIDLRASERAYVSSGQGFAYWKPRVDALFQQIREDLTTLKASTGAGASGAADAALDALNEANRLERRIAEAANAGRIPFAADIVYADGLQASLALEHATDAAITAARGDLEAYQRDARIQELLLAAESAGIGLFLALMWFPSQQKPTTSSVTSLGVGHLDLPLRTEDAAGPAGPKVAPPATPGAAPIASATMPKEKAAAGTAGAAGGADVVGREAPKAAMAREALVAAADLCTQLARVTDAGELGGLMAQMSSQLDAVGVIVWLAAPDGLSLRATLSHGYSSEALSRLGGLDLTSDNATARAFRLVRAQTVSGKDGAPGAIVVPISSGAGCVGVVAAELRHGREQDPATLALARIFAAQLAALTGSSATQASPASPASAGSTGALG